MVVNVGALRKRRQYRWTYVQRRIQVERGEHHCSTDDVSTTTELMGKNNDVQCRVQYSEERASGLYRTSAVRMSSSTRVDGTPLQPGDEDFMEVEDFMELPCDIRW